MGANVPRLARMRCEQSVIGLIPIVSIHSGMVFNGNIAAFQAEVTGSSPVTRFWSYSEVAYHASLSKMYHEFESR